MRRKEMSKADGKINSRNGLPQTRMVCPTGPSHREFCTVAVVCQDWQVDGDGNWIATIEDCTDIYYHPDTSNEWECIECGAIAVKGEKQ